MRMRARHVHFTWTCRSPGSARHCARQSASSLELITSPTWSYPCRDPSQAMLLCSMKSPVASERRADRMSIEAPFFAGVKKAFCPRRRSEAGVSSGRMISSDFLSGRVLLRLKTSSRSRSTETQPSIESMPGTPDDPLVQKGSGETVRPVA